MFSAKDLFKERLKNHLALLNRYLRYIFNGHFMIALLFIIVTMAVFYQRWLEDLPERFPSAIIISVIVTLTISYNPIQTFLQEPDKVFLIVKEQEMKSYFTKSLIYNYIFQLYIVIFVLAAITPLMNKAFPHMVTWHYVLFYSLIFVLKALFMFVHFWKINNAYDQHKLEMIIRMVFLALIFYFYLNQSYVFASIGMILLIGLCALMYYDYQNQPGKYWERLIDNDAERLAQFYQFASMFAEVPVSSEKLKKRSWLTYWLEKYIPFKHDKTYTYLFWLTFARSKEYLNMFMRLSILGCLVIGLIDYEFIQLLLGIIFLYITIFQMVPLFKHYRTFMWLDLYPVSNKEKKHAFMTLSIRLSVIQFCLFTLVFFFTVKLEMVALWIILASLFIFLFHRLYIKKKLFHH